MMPFFPNKKGGTYYEWRFFYDCSDFSDYWFLRGTPEIINPEWEAKECQTKWR